MSNPSAVKNPQLTRNVNVSNEKLSETHISTRKLRQEIRTLKSYNLKVPKFTFFHLGGISSIFSLLLVLGFENCLTITYDSYLSMKLAFT